MTMYDMAIGSAGSAEGLMLILNSIHPIDPPRYRDCYFDGDYIVVHTRTGGGNRDYYESEKSCRNNYPEYFTGSEDDPSGPWNEDLRKHPWFSHDRDSDFDYTYANFYFKPPAEILVSLGNPDITPEEKWAILFEKLNQK